MNNKFPRWLVELPRWCSTRPAVVGGLARSAFRHLTHDFGARAEQERFAFQIDEAVRSITDRAILRNVILRGRAGLTAHSNEACREKWRSVAHSHRSAPSVRNANFHP